MIEQIGAFAGLAAFLGLAVLALLSFAHGRDIRRLRDWAGSAPERDADRKETTSAVAAQRAEELRALEEARTAEREALEEREERRRRREEGLPETTHGERLHGRFSGVGARLAEPRSLAALFVVMLVAIGAATYVLLNDSDDADGRKQARQAAVRMQPSEVEVTVLNGTAVPGLAATFGDMVEGKGFKLGAVTNSSSSFSDSVVMFTRGHKPEANRVANALDIDKVQLMTAEVEDVAEGANVAVIAGEDNASAAS